MKLLRCKICRGEMELINNDRSINRKVKCFKCGFTNANDISKEPEILIIRKKSIMES